MGTLKKDWGNGEKLTVTFYGHGDSFATFTSGVNAGIDREMSVYFVDDTGKIRVERKVKQEGKREVFGCADGAFMLADGGTFNVLKDGLQ